MPSTLSFVNGIPAVLPPLTVLTQPAASMPNTPRNPHKIFKFHCYNAITFP
jgi:hypothetical protein